MLEQATHADTCAIVLTGGKSSRMGQDKALLEYEGQTFLEHVIAAARPLAREVLLVTDRADRYAVRDVRVVVDFLADGGPVAGIVSGLMAAGPGVHVVVPCDMPLVSGSVLKMLLGACSPSWDAAIPELHGEPEPLYGVYRDTALPKLRRYLESGRRSARGALAELNVNRIGMDALRRADPDLTSFHNINTPQELALLLASRPEFSSNATNVLLP